MIVPPLTSALVLAQVKMSMLCPSYFLMMFAVFLSVLKEFIRTKGMLTS
jgi:ABC-type antimicrobial peptide transport system permease subunit